MRHIKDITPSYLGGVIDSDGSLFIRKKGNKLIPTVCITSCHLWYIERIKSYLDSLGIKSRIKEKKSKNPNARKCYDLLVESLSGVYTLITVLYNWIILKENQLFLLEMATLYLKHQKHKIKNHFESEYLVSIYTRLKEHNKRGTNGIIQNANTASN